ncbi:hypothetical protein [Longimicrobium sp.]|uniref:hypothetical protein n=1 Tax=Longimicrobium sp. TaxID=2029185 RepID=UPI002E33D1B7|nr:hypothetical protein [Longimicrobium sp.]HEX6039202.1 hypothetical protein [Longimicrobium sp.]
MDATTATPRDTLSTPARTPSAADTASLAAAIQGLGGMQRLVVSLYYMEGLRLPEIALVLELGELEVAHLYGQALAALGLARPAQRHAA